MSQGNAELHAFFHESSSTVSYMVIDLKTKATAVIDPAADFNIFTGGLDFKFSQNIEEFIRGKQLRLQWILETHVHADHVTAAQYLKSRLGGSIVIGNRITEVQKIFSSIYNDAPSLNCDGSEFDRLLLPNEVFKLGTLEVKAIPTPGHTPACISYLIGDMLFAGDSIFMPDFGTARCDFPGGSAPDLYNSARCLLDLPDETRVFVGHDYGPGGRPIEWETTVGDQKRLNIHVKDGIEMKEFVNMREARDLKLSLPSMIIPSIQINMRAGNLPEADSNGFSYIKTPINEFPGTRTKSTLRMQKNK